MSKNFIFGKANFEMFSFWIRVAIGWFSLQNKFSVLVALICESTKYLIGKVIFSLSPFLNLFSLTRSLPVNFHFELQSTCWKCSCLYTYVYHMYISFTYFLWIFFTTLTKSFDTWMCVCGCIFGVASLATMRLQEFNKFYFNIVHLNGLVGWCSECAGSDALNVHFE